MDDLVGGALGFIAVAVVLVIGGAIVVQTNNVTVELVGSGTILDDLVTNVGTALTTYSSMLTIVALAIIGGLALFYTLGFLRGGRM